MRLRWTQHDPWREFRALQRQMDHMVREMLPTGAGSLAHAGPAFNVTDLGDTYLVEAEVPGVREDDLRIDATVNALTVRAKRNAAAPEGYTAHRTERSELEFSRALTFDSKLDLEAVSARLTHGVLRIELGKQALERPRTIAVKTS